EVGGDNHVELFGPADEVHDQRVAVLAFGDHVGVLRPQFFERLVPQNVGVPLGVALGSHRELAAACAGELEAVAEDALDALAAVQGGLHGNFIGRTACQSAAG